MKVFSVWILCCLLILPNCSAEENFDNSYLQILKHINANDYSAASEEIDLLRHASLDQGYQNLPAYSHKLLENANSVFAEKNAEKAAYLVRQAVLLSPSDVHTLLAASCFYKLVGLKRASSYFLSAISLIVSAPSVVIPIAVNVVWITLIGATISLLFVCVVQLVSHQEGILNSLRERLPRRYRGLLLPIISVAWLFGSLYFGILGAICGWSLFLSRYRSSCRALALHAGIITLLWGAMTPIKERVHSHLNTDFTKSLERISTGAFEPHAKEDLRLAISNGSEEPLYYFLLGRVLVHEGNLTEGAKLFQKTLELSQSSGEKEFVKASYIGLGAIAYLQSNYSSAKSLFHEAEILGGSGFTLLYDLAQTEMLLLDTVSHRKYYTQAVDADEKQVSYFQSIQISNSSPYRRIAFPPAPLMAHYRAYLHPIASVGFPASKLLPGVLLRGGSIQVLLILGGIVFLWGLIYWVRKKPVLIHNQESSKIWIVLPAGRYLSGGKPGTGFLLLTIISSLLIFALERPVHVLQIFPYANPTQMIALFIAGLMIIITACISWSDQGLNQKIFGEG